LGDRMVALPEFVPDRGHVRNVPHVTGWHN
jgi:hypothetical protein